MWLVCGGALDTLVSGDHAARLGGEQVSALTPEPVRVVRGAGDFAGRHGVHVGGVHAGNVGVEGFQVVHTADAGRGLACGASFTTDSARTDGCFPGVSVGADPPDVCPCGGEDCGGCEPRVTVLIPLGCDVGVECFQVVDAHHQVWSGSAEFFFHVLSCGTGGRVAK